MEVRDLSLGIKTTGGLALDRPLLVIERRQHYLVSLLLLQ